MMHDSVTLSHVASRLTSVTSAFTVSDVTHDVRHGASVVWGAVRWFVRGGFRGGGCPGEFVRGEGVVLHSLHLTVTLHVIFV